MDKIVKAISADGFVRLTAITSKDLCERARQIHATTPVATAALGRTLSATAMMGSDLKKTDASITIRINGAGPIGTLMTVSDSSGNVRGYAQNPNVQLPLKSDGKLDVGRAVGTDGLLTVIRDISGEGEPYTGSVTLVSGEIAEDFTAYFAESEQTPTAVALGVLVDVNYSVKAAGGYIAQLLPGAPNDLIDQLEQNISALGYVTNHLADQDATSLVYDVLKNMNPEILSEQPIEYHCYCSRDRALKTLSSLGETDRNEIKGKNEPIEVTCQFCDAVYVFDPSEI
ncbi:MAG: Hsp33 family molecular chaperone HslO [Clostridiales Family XIII bacterium]|nr:Hsp33 family molecular chaperone HslO [Clostridiales Family XIII bacterium]